MTNISILDDGTINKIAAGEVIDRPSSIIKELVENSIDAKATAITIEIESGGLNYIRVTDNGLGMGKEDAKISLKRHATSKIKQANDLEGVLTLGFRGEALASIAAVTEMELITRQKDSISGYNIINKGGTIVSEGEIGCPEGTTIIVENLFFNTPARLKFLKSPRAETAQISDIVARLVLANPQISFKYVNNGKVIYYSSGDGDLKNAAFSIYGGDIVRQTIPIETSKISTELNAFGLLGTPGLSRKNRNYQSFFVNGRYVKSNLLIRALETAYKPYLTINRFPWAVIYIEINPSLIDINVHPAKIEIRFKNEHKVEKFLIDHIGSILNANPYIPKINLPKSEGATEADYLDKKYDTKISKQLGVFPKMEADPDTYRKDDKSTYDKTLSNNNMGSISSNFMGNPEENYINESTDGLKVDPYPKGMYNEQLTHNIDKDLSSFKVIGRLFSTYIVLEDGIQCYIVDQHAAHERLLFERYKEMIYKGDVITQQLLPAAIIEVTHNEKLAIMEFQTLFYDAGFDIEEFGDKAFAIRGIPVVLGTSDIKGFFYGLLDEIDKQNYKSDFKLKIDDVILMSCKNAVKAGDQLSDIEIQALLEDILSNDIPMTCPHGRPIMISISKKELEKSFKRIQ